MFNVFLWLSMGAFATAFGQYPFGTCLQTAKLAEPSDAEACHFSSYDPNGGNSDLGHYYGVDEFGWRVLCDVQGPGAITDMWWTKPGGTNAWRIRVFVDDMTHAVIDTPIIYIFGEMDPFLPPIADSSTNSYYSYAPIPFQTRGRICYNNASAIYFHVTAHKYPAGTVVESFTMPPSASYLAKLDSLAAMLSAPMDALFSPPASWSDELTTELADGTTVSLNSTETQGRTRRVLLRLQNRTQQVLENFWVRVFTDRYPLPDIEGPVSTVMGAALGWRPYQSCVTGMSGDSIYFNLPIWFDGGLRLEFENRTGNPQHFTAKLESLSEPAKSWRLMGQYREANPTLLWENYDIASFEGPGNYVGTILDMQQRNNHVLEGDERFVRDSEAAPFWRGTGTEDYFKGGYYWYPSYERLGLHGCIAYLGDSAAAYRWHLSDFIPFDTKLHLDIEVGKFNNLQGHYRSVGYAYCARPKWRVLDASGDGKTHAGEILRIVGNGLDPGDAVDGVAMNGTWLLPDDGADLTISVDSIFDATFLASDTLVAGGYALIAMRASEDTIDGSWEHLADATLSFRPQRTDIDSTVHSGDTLAIDIHGLIEGETATVTVGGVACLWIGLTPYGDASGKLVGKVRLPAELETGDLQLAAVPQTSGAVVCATPVKYRNWFRVEPEVLTYSQWSGTRIRDEWCGDYLLSGNTDPWGRMATQVLTGTNATSYVVLPFYSPYGGRYRAGYFFGRTSAGAMVSMEINTESSLANYDSYLATQNQSWSRSDTVWGSEHELAEGLNTIKMRTVGINPLSIGWKAVLDQVIFESVPAFPMQFAADSVVIWAEGSEIHLAWSPIVSDINGIPGIPDFVDIYRSTSPDSIFYLCSSIAGTDTTWSEAIPANEGTFIYQVLGRGSGVAAMREIGSKNEESEVGNGKLKREEKDASWEVRVR